jgi:Fe-S oxidoreductase
MPSQILLHAQACLDCGLCVRECAFLQKYGSPRHIAVSWQPENPVGQQLPFACNLCGLCAALCPPKVGLEPAAMFLEMRQQVVEQGTAPFPEHKGLIAYERRGVSDRYSSIILPKYCDTILFPGCTFSGTRPARLLELFQCLRKTIPHLGMVLGCCTKPSHDLGRKDFFKHTFNELCQSLVQQGIRRVLVICPSCHTIFSQYGGPLTTEYVYNLLAEQPLPKSILLEKKKAPNLTSNFAPDITIHDPCTTRKDPAVHSSVRCLLHAAGFSVQEMSHHGEKTLCCGEGGAVPFIDKQLARSWGDCRRQEVKKQGPVPLTVTYCAGCVNFLSSRMRIVHLLDLLFAPEAALGGRVTVSRPPFTYLNRLLLKRRLKKIQKEQADP